MILIVDANIIISALIRNSKTRELLTISPFTLYSPGTLIESIEKYKDEFVKKSGLSLENFDTLLKLILEKTIIVKKEKYSSKLEEASKIMGNIDMEDVPYIALALSIPNDGIWSDDKHFQRQKAIKIWKTKDIIETLDRFEITLD